MFQSRMTARGTERRAGPGDAAESAPTEAEWYLRGEPDDSGSVLRTSLYPLPFLVGRQPGSDLRLGSNRVSQRHAEIVDQGGRLCLRDLGSTNGTFVNGEPVTERLLREGDILHFADQQFRLEVRSSQQVAMQTLRFTGECEVAPRAIQHVRELVQLIRTRAVLVEYQPLVRMRDGAVVAYEGLGRGDQPGIPASPGELLAVAEGLDMAAELSALFRERQLEEATRLPKIAGGEAAALFLNTHPAEMRQWQAVLDSLEAFRRRQPGLPVVLEIHESAVTDLATFRALRQQLDALDVEQAFDDFGTGQARLEELCEVSPDYVKFDRNFARDLHRASPKRREMVRNLVRMMVDMRISTVIEGVENAEEAAVSRDLGFDYAQGYYFGRPAPLAALG